MDLTDKYLNEIIRKPRKFSDIVDSLDYVIDNIIEVNPSKEEIKVIKGMITALERKIKKI